MLKYLIIVGVIFLGVCFYFFTFKNNTLEIEYLKEFHDSYRNINKSQKNLDDILDNVSFKCKNYIRSHVERYDLESEEVILVIRTEGNLKIYLFKNGNIEVH